MDVGEEAYSSRQGNIEIALNQRNCTNFLKCCFDENRTFDISKNLGAGIFTKSKLQYKILSDKNSANICKSAAKTVAKNVIISLRNMISIANNHFDTTTLGVQFLEISAISYVVEIQHRVLCCPSLHTHRSSISGPNLQSSLIKLQLWLSLMS